jgi:hypothetical protein
MALGGLSSTIRSVGRGCAAGFASGLATEIALRVAGVGLAASSVVFAYTMIVGEMPGLSGLIRGPAVAEASLSGDPAWSEAEADPIVTGSIPAPPVSAGPSRPTTFGRTVEYRAADGSNWDGKRPVLKDYVLRAVTGGAAIVVGPDATRVVSTGDVLPGIGRVEAIEWKPDGWAVVTPAGLIREEVG